MFAAVRQHGCFGQRACLLHHIELHGFTRVCAGQADSGHLEHVGVHHDHFFDLVGVDVEARHQNQVLEPVDDADETLVVHQGDVAGAQEPVGGHHCSGFFRALPIAQHDLRAAHAQLAGHAQGQLHILVVADRHLGGWHGQADAAVECGQVQRVDGHGGRALGEPIAFDQRCPGHGLPALGHRPLHGAATADGKTQLAEVDLGKVGVVEQAVEERIDGRQPRKAVLGQHLHKGRNVAWVGHQHVAATQADEAQAGAQCEDVIQRNGRDADEPFGLVQEGLAPDRALLHIGQDVSVREHGTFGHAGGAPGVLQEGDVVRRNAAGLENLLGALGQHRSERDTVWQLVGLDQLLDPANHEVADGTLGPGHQVGQARDHHVLDRRVGDHLGQGVGKKLHHHHGHRARVAQLVLKLARRVHGVDVDHHIARTQQTEQAHRVLQQVGHHQRHASALRQFQDLLEVGCDLPTQGVELAVADGPACGAADERGPVGKPGRGVVEVLRDGAQALDVDVRRNAERVTLKPDAFHASGWGGVGARGVGKGCWSIQAGTVQQTRQ